jgi:gliding motility-associated-like protein
LSKRNKKTDHENHSIHLRNHFLISNQSSLFFPGTFAGRDFILNYSRMKQLNYFFCLSLFFVLTTSAHARDGKDWIATANPEKSFIENKGQFKLGSEKAESPSAVKFAYDGGSTMIYFTPSGISYSFLKRWKDSENEDSEEMARERAREQKEMREGKPHAEIEAEEHRMKFKTDVVNMIWEGANPDAQLIAEDATSDYHVYVKKNREGKEESINSIKAYRKLIYKNLYPGIDVEYVFHPEVGIKYTIILRPGADASQIKMRYSDNVHLGTDGNIHITTKFGDVIDHAPISYYTGISSSAIKSHFTKTGKVVSFGLADYDHAQSVTIDPWTVAPTGLNNSNCVWECEKDAAGNAYIIGGDSPMKLKKYNSAGVLQWTYNTPWDTANYWLGTLATDQAGNSYVTAGSVAKLQKVSTAGTMIYSVSGGSLDEYWTISFNCDQTKLIVGGTRLGPFPPAGSNGVIFDINTATGAVSAIKKVGWSRTTTIFGFPVTDIEEVRSMTPSYNSRYYYLTLDSIGAIDQNFSACPSSGSTLLGINDGFAWGYKCENYRPNNGNAGVKAIRANQNFVYTHNGTTVQKRSLTTGAVITSAAIPGGLSVASGSLNQAGCAGIDIDSCGNVYVGSTNAVIKYDANLVLLTSVATTYKVFDVAVSYGGNVIVCGATGDASVAARTGYVQQINMSSCNPMALICCNTNVCAAGPFCVTAAPVTLTPDQAGGTWSGPGVNAVTGVFNPATAGVGTHTITYSLACGTGSITIVVNSCTALAVCQNAGPTLTVSGGTGPYTWQQQVTTTPCVPGAGFCSGFGTVAGPPVTSWSTFATGTTVTPPGTYPIQVVDNSGTTYVINSLGAVPSCTSCPALTITPASQVNVNCFGQSTGSFSVSTTGGASPYDYTLMNGATTIASFSNIAGSQSFTSLPAGTYTLNVLDNNGCPGSTTITITQPASTVSVSITGTTAASCGANNGAATAQASGGSSPYDYVWTGSAGTLQTTNNITTSNSLTGLTAGTYTVTITDNNNCTTTATAVVTSTTGATVSITAQTNILCFGAATGSATATATGGSSPYDYVWTGSAGTLQTTNNIAGANTLSSLAAGTYTVTVTDNSGCTSTATATITEPASAAAVSITGSASASCGASNGTATAQASGGSSPYDYVWTGTAGTLQTTNNITTSNTLSALSAGTYTVTVTDNNNCSTSTTVTITSTGGATVSITAQTNVLCFGGSNGSATATASGGTSPYDYVWTGSAGTLQTTNNISGPDVLNTLSAGTYTVSVTDNAGCLSTATATITEPATAASVSITGTTSTPCGSATGSATAQAGGGTSPYDYVWTGSAGTLQTTNNISGPDVLNGLLAGTYTVTITDANNCTSTATASVTSTGGASVSLTQTDVLCFGESTGDATATASGGTSPYDYVWTNASGTLQSNMNVSGPDIIDSLPAGSYTITVTDNGGCISTATATITEPATAASVSVTGTTPAACGTANGSATAQASGGTGPYDYVWTGSTGTLQTTNNSASPDVLSSIASGTYTVTITDNNGCSSSTTATVTNSGGATTSVTSSSNVSCFGGNNGSATANTTGGTGPYDYVWTGSSGTVHTDNNISVPSTASALTSGTYTITVTDNGGCISTATVTITQPSVALSLATSSSVNTTCGLSNGSANTTASGGTGGYSYSWAPSVSTGPSASSLASGTYLVTVTDGNSCTATTNVTIGSSTGVTAAVTSQTNVLCNGDSTGTATVSASGGTGTYTYVWTDSVGSAATATGLSAGSYTITVTSSSCSNTASVTITEPSAIAASISSTPATCSNANGTAAVSASGGTGTYSYLWANGETTMNADSLNPGTISVTVTDAAGCSQTASGIIGSTGSITADAGADITITLGQSTTLTASGGTTYTWSPTNGLSCSSCANPVASPTQSMTYCVLADSSSCTDTACVRITVETPCPTNKDLAVPNAFSPNEDGHNDILCLQGWSNCIQTFSIYIYDRWGEKVFESSDAGFCWDGTYRGRALDPAVFVYFITATFSNDTKIETKGNISLIR